MKNNPYQESNFKQIIYTFAMMSLIMLFCATFDVITTGDFISAKVMPDLTVKGAFVCNLILIIWGISDMAKTNPMDVGVSKLALGSLSLIYPISLIIYLPGILIGWSLGMSFSFIFS